MAFLFRLSLCLVWSLTPVPLLFSFHRLKCGAVGVMVFRWNKTTCRSKVWGLGEATIAGLCRLCDPLVFGRADAVFKSDIDASCGCLISRCNSSTHWSWVKLARHNTACFNNLLRMFVESRRERNRLELSHLLFLLQCLLPFSCDHLVLIVFVEHI